MEEETDPLAIVLQVADLPSEESRDEIFRNVATALAAERGWGGMRDGERGLLVEQLEMRMRCLDRYHVARLLAANYAEACRFMKFETLITEYKALAGELRESSRTNPVLRDRVALYREIIEKNVRFLEGIFPDSAGTHNQVAVFLRHAALANAPSSMP